ncbi:lipid A biosynthesis acyltransferase [Sulfurimonas sp. MAG313]|nr:lipid A biosynthesis acyltransferase [Sulfurimonas sp. MAG313]
MALPYGLQKILILGLAKLAYIIDSRHKNIIKANLDLSIKDNISAEKYQDIVKYCHKNLALVLLQVLRSSRLSVQSLEESVSFENRHYIDEAIKEGRKIIIISAHYGNWELGATAIGALIHPITSIHKKMNNKYFDDYLLKSRSKFNMTMIEKKGAIRHLVKAIKSNKIITMMIDQNVNPKDGIYVDFLGAKATQSAAPAFLARKFDALIIPILIHTTPEKENVIRFFEPIQTPKTDNEEEDILNSTQAQADMLADVIKNHPEPWFWCHKRWKSAHAEIY